LNGLSGASQQSTSLADARAEQISAIAQVVGAMVLSRACPDDSPLADEILAVCRKAALAHLPPGSTA